MTETKKRLLTVIVLAALALSSVAAAYVPPPEPVTTVAPSDVPALTLSGVVMWSSPAKYSFGLSAQGRMYTIVWDKTTVCQVESIQGNPLPSTNCALVVPGELATVTGVSVGSNYIKADLVRASFSQSR